MSIEASQNIDNLLNNSFRLITKKTLELHITGLLWGKFTGDWWILITKFQYCRKLLHIDGLLQERHNYIANALELCLSCTNPSISWGHHASRLPNYASNIVNIGSDNGLLPGRRLAIIWTNAGILLNGPLGINFNEIWIEIDTFSFKKMHLRMSSAKWWPSCLGLNVLKVLFRLPNYASN